MPLEILLPTFAPIMGLLVLSGIILGGRSLIKQLGLIEDPPPEILFAPPPPAARHPNEGNTAELVAHYQQDRLHCNRVKSLQTNVDNLRFYQLEIDGVDEATINAHTPFDNIATAKQAIERALAECQKALTEARPLLHTENRTTDHPRVEALLSESQQAHDQVEAAFSKIPESNAKLMVLTVIFIVVCIGYLLILQQNTAP